MATEYESLTELSTWEVKIAEPTPEPKERPRLVISCSASDKYGLAFCCGALLALRDLHLLDHTAVIVGSGQACLLQTWLMAASRVHGWDKVRAVVPAGEPDPLLAIAGATLSWCVEGHEHVIFWQRLKRLRWSTWMDPWMEDLVVWLQQTYDLKELWRWYCADSGPTAPLMLFGVQIESTFKSIYVSSRNRAVNAMGSHVRVLAHTQITDFDRVLCAAIAPPKRFESGVAVDVCPRRDSPHIKAHAPSTWEMYSGLAVDPLNTAVSNIFYMAEHLDFQPHSHDKERDLGGLPEKDVGQKLLLIDAFTHSPAFDTTGRFEVATRNAACLSQVEVLSAPDEKNERLLCYRRRYVTMHPAEHEHALGGPGGRYTQFTRALTQHIKDTGDDCELTGCDEVWLKRCVAAGYYRTFDAYAPRGVRPQCPLADVDDPWNILDGLFAHIRPVECEMDALD